jgi:hypothetical protein
MLFACRYCCLKAKRDLSKDDPRTSYIFMDKNNKIIEQTDKCTCYKIAEIFNNAFSPKGE